MAEETTNESKENTTFIVEFAGITHECSDPMEAAEWLMQSLTQQQ